MFLHGFANNLIARVAHAVMTSQPATLLRKKRYLAIIKHDREAILIERGLFARPHRLVVAVVPIPFPLLPIEAHIIVHAPLSLQMGLPLKAEIGVLGVVRGLYLHLDRAVFARNRRRLKVATLHDLFAPRLFGAFVAGDTSLPLPHHLGASMSGTQQPV